MKLDIENACFVENFYTMNNKDEEYTKQVLIDSDYPQVTRTYNHHGLFYRKIINSNKWKCVLDTNFDSSLGGSLALYIDNKNKKYPIFYGISCDKNFYSNRLDNWIQRRYYRMYVGLYNESKKEVTFKQISFGELPLYTKKKKIIEFFHYKLAIHCNPIYVPNNIEIVEDGKTTELI